MDKEINKEKFYRFIAENNLRPEALKALKFISAKIKNKPKTILRKKIK